MKHCWCNFDVTDGRPTMLMNLFAIQTL